MGLLGSLFRNRFLSKILETNDPPERIARGVAAGTFIAVSPTVGFQTLLALLLATVLRGNRLVAVAMTFVLNPFIFVPPSYWYFPSYYLGAFLLGMEPVGLSRVAAAYESAEGISDLLSKLWSLGIEIYGPMFLGSVVIGVPLALLMYRISSGVVVRHRAKREGNDGAPDKMNGGNVAPDNNNRSAGNGDMLCAGVGPGEDC